MRAIVSCLSSMTRQVVCMVRTQVQPIVMVNEKKKKGGMQARRVHVYKRKKEICKSANPARAFIRPFLTQDAFNRRLICDKGQGVWSNLWLPTNECMIDQRQQKKEND